ncbi:FACT complex subunit Spt16p [[Candida] jaroonii]|uniref:FACT complex subunit Spt16p n=1 Tax=[Candida] jaroonii TaxID=467808 RepID=A0ACA9YBU6_9ASCO|nr:FACT complex subunit Spt16p [[Candida] jaroonii]
MSEVVIDSEQFHKRLSIIQKNLVGSEFKSLLYLVGARDDDNTYKKPTVLQNWLLGYEFVHSGVYITEDKCCFITSENKTKYLKGLVNKPTPNSSSFEIWTRTKDVEVNKGIFQKLLDQLKEDKKVGIIEKAKYKGKFIDEWEEFDKSSIEFIDSSILLSKSMEVKDSDEFNNHSIASKSSIVMMDIFINEMMKIVDEDSKITHSKFSESLEDKIDRNNWYSKNDMGKKLLQNNSSFDPELLDWCYSPIIQSGNEFDLKPSAQSSDKVLKNEGVILSSIGLRFKNYCSNIGRSFLIDPTKEMEDNYDFLIKLQNHLIDEVLVDGKIAKDVYEEATKFITKENPSILDNFTRNCGWLMGIEFRDSTLILNSKNERKLANGQIFSLTIGFSDLINKSNNKKYSLMLTDTVKITDSKALVLTNHLKNKSEITFYFKEDKVLDELNGDDKSTKIKSEKDIKIEKNLAANEANSKILKQKLRNETTQNDDNLNNEQIRQEIQGKLHEKRLQEGLSRFSRADAADESENKPIFKKYDSYMRESQIPSNVRDLKIHVDYKNQTIILPICGRPVPFHINSFKNGSQNEEGDFTYLRLNFNSPGAGGNVSKKTELPYEDSPDNTFLRSLTFRSRDRQRMVDVYKAIQDLKKDSVKREQEKKQMADVVSQANLVEFKGSRVSKLENVLVRPQQDSKKTGGTLQIHENGLRYQSNFKIDQRIDIIFSNIKHLFYQPSKDELIVLIHCHLKTPIMIGKRKTYDVQFYKEASDMAFDETGGRKRKYRYGDEDELQQEQEERRRKALLDKEFKIFAQKIADASNGRVDLDIPFRELGFQGVPFRSAVFCMPTRDCLIQLIDPPYLVVTLEEIEIAHLERVQFGLKNFDLVFVFKDFNKPVVHINTIPMELLEDVKNWLTDVDIPISEGQMNLNWPSIMKTVLADPYQFFVDGGWSFLTGTGESDEEEEEEEESEFEVSDEDPSDEDVGSGAEESDDYSEGSASGSDFDEDEESGEDWDEMEKKAAREDKAAFRD